ncbi:MAG: hypothetical protein C4519_13320 [Desulfobacteraceae bacterium]|nr:MAG: hypothetical protein C4519_13320 [Desulfobacteraceae bacterium]
MAFTKHCWITAMLLLILPAVIIAADAPQNPDAYLPQTVYEFKPVVEGTPIEHEFTIQNRGTATLEILDLKSG